MRIIRNTVRVLAATSDTPPVVAEAVSNPERIMREDLQNFARLVERGGVEVQTPSR